MSKKCILFFGPLCSCVLTDINMLFISDVFYLFHRDKWVPVATAWRVLRLRMEERPPIWWVKFTLEQATKVRRGSRGIALLFL